VKLYWSRMSPFVRKVMIVAHETGLADALELEETMVAMSAANPALMAHNPLSQIPLLLLDNGDALHDSRVICEYLDSLHDGIRLFPTGGAIRWNALQRQALGDGMLDVLVVWRQEQLKPGERRTPEWLETFAIKITATLDRLETRAEAFAALPFDIGHAAIGCALGYIDFRFPHLGWRETRPALACWHASFERRPSAVATPIGEPA